MGINFSTALETKAQRQIQLLLKADSVVDYCGDKSIVLVVDAGEIFDSDKLSLYELSISFDRKKLKFINYLKSGTLSEDLEYVIGGIQDSGIVRISGFNVLRNIKGSKPLVGLLFRYFEGCDGNVSFNFAYPPEKNDDANVVFNAEAVANLSIRIVDKASRSLKIEFSNDTIEVNKDKSVQLDIDLFIPIGVTLSNLQSMVNIDTTLIKVSNVTINNNLILVKTEAKYINLVSTSKSISGQLKLTMDILSLKNIQYDTKMSIRPMLFDSCACISKVMESEVTIKGKVSTDIKTKESIQQQEEIQLLHNANVWELKTSFNTINKIELYNIVGNKIYSNQYMEPQGNVYYNDSAISPGIYIIHVFLENGKTTTLKLIK